MRLKRILFALFACLALWTTKTDASHIYGGFLTYECVGACTVKVIFRAYRDCTGTTVIGNSVSFNTSMPGCGAPTPLGAWSPQITTEITPICPGVPTQCTSPGAVINGVQEYYWDRDYSYCSLNQGCEYELTWTTCCRNAGITALTNAGSQSMMVGTYFQVDFSSCNNPVRLAGLPPSYIAAAQPVTITYGAYDPDGDSLAFHLDSCRTSGWQGYCLYSPGHSPSQPLGPSWLADMDVHTGNLTLQPVPGNVSVGVVCVTIEEWRNGVLINQTIRDHQLLALTMPGMNTPQLSAYSNLSTDLQVVGDVFSRCNVGPVQFDVGATDPDNNILKLSWDQHIPGASFVDATNPSIQDTITGASPVGRFTFNPPGVGTYYFYLRVQDDQCPVSGFSEKLIKINVGTGGTSQASANMIGCAIAQFGAVACGGNPPYTYQWSGTGGLSGNTAIVNHTYPGPGTYPWQCIVSDGNTVNDTIQDTIIVPGPTYQSMIQPGGLVFVCQGSSQIINVGNGYTSYNWSTGATTNSISVSNTGTYSVTVTDQSGCIFFDSVNVVTQGLTWQPMILGNNVLDYCVSASESLWVFTNYSGYSWSTGATTQGITVNSPATYSVTVTDWQGCQYWDSIVVTDVPPDISGVVTDHLLNPLQNQRVFLVKHDTSVQSLTAVDTAFTDNSGYYQFCGIQDSILYIKAAPDSAAYPTEMPTYADTSLVWNNARAFSVVGVPYVVNFATKFGTNPGGPGFIGGLIINGAGKVAGGGGPAAGLALILYNKDGDYPVAETVTDANGYFSFDNIPLGNYALIPDKPNVSHTNVPQITLNALNTTLDSLPFTLHANWLQLDGTGTSLQDPRAEWSIKVAPQPARESCVVHLELPENAFLKMQLYDVQGRNLAIVSESEFQAGAHTLPLNLSSFADGIYYLKLESEHFRKTLKILKNGGN